MALTVAAPVRIHAQPAKNFVGERVVQKFGSFTMHIENRPVDTKNSLYLFRVEQIDGSSLLLKADGSAVNGWASADSVIPVERAVDFFTIQIRDHPQKSFPRMMRGRIWGARDEFDKAIADLTEAIRLDPNSSLAYQSRGWAWGRKNEYDKAIADYSEAIRLDPNSSRAYRSRGWAWGRKNEPDKAIADLTEAIRLDPKFAWAFEYRGDAWSAKNEYDKAIADYSEAIRLDPNSSLAYQSRGWAWGRKNESDQAVADYSEAIRLDPKFARAFESRGDAWCAKHEYDKAIAGYSEAIRLDPKFAWTFNNRGDAWCAQKDYDKAIADYCEAIRLDPTDAFTYGKRGDAWFAKQEYNKAVADYDEAIRLESNQERYSIRRSRAESAAFGYWMWVLIGGVGLGALAGLVPLFLGVIKDKAWLAAGGFLACVAGGLIAGVLGALTMLGISSAVLARRAEPASSATEAIYRSSRKRYALGWYLVVMFFAQTIFMAGLWSLVMSSWMGTSFVSSLIPGGASFGLATGIVVTVSRVVRLRTGTVRMRFSDLTEFRERFDTAAAKRRYKCISNCDGSLVFEPKALVRTEATRIFVAFGAHEAVATGPLESLKRLKKSVESAGTT